MKPPMREKVILHQVLLGDQKKPIKDQYGRPKTKPTESNARVLVSTRVVKGTDGQQYETSLEVDVPPELKISFGDELEYTSFHGLGITTKGLVRSINESTNLAGNKVYFMTVYVG